MSRSTTWQPYTAACKNNIDLEGYLMGKPTSSAFYMYVIKQGA